MAESENVGLVGTGSVRYRIVVRGELGPLIGPFENLKIFSYSVMIGDIVDQAQLHGILEWLGERGVQIVSVSPAGDCHEGHDLGGEGASCK